MDIVAKKYAKDNDLVRYFTGESCARGHVAERYTKTGTCVECNRERSRQWTKNNPEKHREKARKWRKKNPDAAKRAAENWRKKNPDKVREIARRRANRRYQKNPEKYREVGRKHAKLPKPTRPEPEFCECCGNSPDTKYKSLCVDHCHETGEFRGWLCSRCNRAIGLLGDTIETVKKVVTYMERTCPPK